MEKHCRSYKKEKRVRKKKRNRERNGEGREGERGRGRDCYLVRSCCRGVAIAGIGNLLLVRSSPLFLFLHVFIFLLFFCCCLLCWSMMTKDGKRWDLSEALIEGSVVENTILHLYFIRKAKKRRVVAGNGRRKPNS